MANLDYFVSHLSPAPEDTLGGRVTEDQRTVTVSLVYEKTQGNHGRMFGAGELKSEIQSCV